MTSSLTQEKYDEPIRQLTICNACRYCEGLCAVWDAIELRSSFEKKDVDYLANLCHDCGDCYTVCPYTPPHTLNINIPKIMSEVRLASYEEYTSPKFLAKAFRAQAKYSAVAVALSLAILATLVLVIGSPLRLVTPQLAAGSFYVVVPSLIIDTAGVILGLYIIGVWFYGVSNYWKGIAGNLTKMFNPRALWFATREAFGHRWFKGGGAGCMYPDPGQDSKPSYLRFYLHALVFFGVVLDFVSTISATVYQDFLGLLPPYSVVSVPVLLGTSGGIMILLGVLVLLGIDVSNKPTTLRSMVSLDRTFLVVLFLVAFSGLATLVFRTSGLMGILMTVHLGLVLALFLTAPYGKFVHFTYRYAALVLNRIEQSSRP